MMPKTPMKDLVVIVPGVTGSVLQKDGRDLWAISGQSLWNAALSFGNNLQELMLASDDPNVDDLEDGIRATRVMPGAHIVPGLIKIAGYAPLSRIIAENFRVIKGDVQNCSPANYFEFPYDWRRDNRVSGRGLKRLVDKHLPIWRSWSGASDAKVILVAHSMGGIVARWYLELLDGWKECKALITFGTPYRGSVNALDYLSNGYKKMFVDLTEVMRSFTSVYQLMPIYKMLRSSGEYRRIAETENIPNIDGTRASHALTFHRDIERAVIKNQEDSSYRDHAYQTIPIIGTKQPTLQSADLLDNHLVMSCRLPSSIDLLLSDGDGTVPFLSAIPIELSKEFRDSSFAERHSSLQTNVLILERLLGWLKRTQIRGLDLVRESTKSKDMHKRDSISIEIDDAFSLHEPIHLNAKVGNPHTKIKRMKASIRAVDGRNLAFEIELHKNDEGWSITLDTLDPGLYCLQVTTDSTDFLAPAAVNDLFEVTS